MIPDIAAKCVTDIADRCKTVPLVSNKVFWIYSEDDLVNTVKQILKPCVGVVYEGVRKTGAQRAGIECHLSVSVVVVADAKDIAALDRKQVIVQVLDQIRGAIKDTKSPTGHVWSFLMEAATANIANNVLYVQRWETFCPI